MLCRLTAPCAASLSFESASLASLTCRQVSFARDRSSGSLGIALPSVDWLGIALLGVASTFCSALPCMAKNHLGLVARRGRLARYRHAWHPLVEPVRLCAASLRSALGSLGVTLLGAASASRVVSLRSSACSTSPWLASPWLRAASHRLVSLQLARHRLALPRLARHSFAWRRVGFARYRLRTASPCPAWARAATPCLAPPRLAAATSRSVSARSASPCSASPCFISLRPCAAPSRFVLARLASPCLASLRLRAALTCSASPRSSSPCLASP